MRMAYALLGLAWLVVFASLYFFLNHNIMSTVDTDTPMPHSLTLTSTVFGAGESIPSKFTCDAADPINPPLSISGVPEGSMSLALIMDDPDVPKQIKPDGIFDHWILFNIPVPARAGESIEIDSGAEVGTPGANGAGKPAYAAPCPPAQYEPSEHRYVFTLYALDEMLSLPAGVSKTALLQAMEGHVVAQTELIGRYKRQ